MSEAERNSMAIWNMVKEVEEGRAYKKLLENIRERLIMAGYNAQFITPGIIEDINKALKGKE